ncbi:MAG: SHOCT domain-containing protein [Cyanobacteria bacterium P01_E01_bin.42]
MLRDLLNSLFRVSDKTAIDSLIEKCSYAAAALTILPIPGSEIVAVMPIHVGMVVGIAQAKGVDITRESAINLVLQISATVGLSLVGSRLATTAAKILLPGFGGIISAPFMFASTLALGNVAKVYFEREGDIDKDTMKDIYNDMVKRGKQMFDSDRMKDEEIQDMAKAASREGEEEKKEEGTPAERLGKLKELLDLGLISQEEFDETKRKILSEI